MPVTATMSPAVPSAISKRLSPCEASTFWTRNSSRLSVAMGDEHAVAHLDPARR